MDTMDRSTTLTRPPAPASTAADRRSPLAGRLLVASGVVGGVSLVFLIAMFAAFGAGARAPGMALGWVNDVLGLLSCLLALPAVIAVHRLLKPAAPVASLALAVLGMLAFSAIVVLQLLLVANVLTFDQQVGPVSIAYLALAAWFVLTGHLGSVGGTIPRGVRWGVFAGAYVGYPFWAVRTARILEAPRAHAGAERPPTAA
jgi:hypothetical protein